MIASEATTRTSPAMGNPTGRNRHRGKAAVGADLVAGWSICVNRPSPGGVEHGMLALYVVVPPLRVPAVTLVCKTHPHLRPTGHDRISNGCQTPGGMKASRTEIRTLEAIAGRAWPTRETIGGPGWETRFADGMHRRLNSASVWESTDLEALIDDIEAWYRERGHPAIFKLTQASAPGLESLLATRGYVRDAGVAVMTTDLTGLKGTPGLEIVPAATTRWMDAFAAMSGYGPARRTLLEDLLGRIEPTTGFVAVDDGNTPVAVGLAVVDGDHAGLFEMATRPDRRRRGLATRVVGALLTWSRSQGARTGYLQVFEGNTPAERLYRSAGFVTRYRYWYRMPPGGIPAARR